MTDRQEPLPYNQVRSHGDLLIVAGQVPMNVTGVASSDSFAEQVQHVFRNLAEVLEAGGSHLRDIVKTTCYLADFLYFDEFNDLYRQYFTEPYPVRTTIKVDLPRGFLLEVEAWAVRSPHSSDMQSGEPCRDHTPPA